MANTTVDTGHGASIALSSQGFTFNLTGIDTGEETITDVSTDTLASSVKTYVPGDLEEKGAVTIPFQWDSSANQLQKGVVETLTITYPLADGQTTAATEAGTGYIKRIKKPNLQSDQLQNGEITFKWNGLTGPVFTPGS